MTKDGVTTNLQPGEIKIDAVDLTLPFFLTRVRIGDASFDIAPSGITPASASGPTVSGIAPGTGPGGGGTSVTINGSNFLAGASVAIGGSAASNVSVVNTTTLTATTGAHPGGLADVTVTNPNGLMGTLPGGFLYAAPQSGFFTLAPCRALDTRDAAFGGPVAANTTRVFAIAGKCGVPFTARTISANLTVTQPSDLGYVTVYPAGTGFPLVSSVNYGAGQTRANNAVVALGLAGDIAVRFVLPSGTAHFILDVNGYFE